MTTTNQLVRKLLNYRNVLRGDGVSTIEYVEQLTCLLFLKMADERLKALTRSPMRADSCSAAAPSCAVNRALAVLRST